MLGIALAGLLAAGAYAQGPDKTGDAKQDIRKDKRDLHHDRGKALLGKH
jgi:hypothetical protein